MRTVQIVHADAGADEVDVELDVFHDGVCVIGNAVEHGGAQGEAVAEDAAGETELLASAGAHDIDGAEGERGEFGFSAGSGGGLIAALGCIVKVERGADAGDEIGRDGGIRVEDEEGVGTFAQMREGVKQGEAFAGRAVELGDFYACAAGDAARWRRYSYELLREYGGRGCAVRLLPESKRGSWRGVSLRYARR